jgi:hypothetical protein
MKFAAEVSFTTKAYMGIPATSFDFAIDSEGRSAWDTVAEAETAGKESALLLHLPGTQVGWKAVEIKTLHPNVQEALLRIHERKTRVTVK